MDEQINLMAIKLEDRDGKTLVRIPEQRVWLPADTEVEISTEDFDHRAIAQGAMATITAALEAAGLEALQRKDLEGIGRDAADPAVLVGIPAGDGLLWVTVTFGGIDWGADGADAALEAAARRWPAF